MRDVHVAGVGMIRFGRYKDRDVPDLGGEAALLALDDAGLGVRDVEFLAAGSLFQANAMVGQRILQQIGQTGICSTADPDGRQAAETNILSAQKMSLRGRDDAIAIDEQRAGFGQLCRPPIMDGIVP